MANDNPIDNEDDFDYDNEDDFDYDNEEEYDGDRNYNEDDIYRKHFEDDAKEFLSGGDYGENETIEDIKNRLGLN